MLNTFPELLTFSLFAPLILRVVLGLVFLNLGYQKFGRERNSWVNFFSVTPFKPANFWVNIFAAIQIVGGLMLIVGYYTQIAALVFAVITLAELYVENREPALLNRNLVFYLLLFAISLSLLFTGAGFLAFDLPL
jgi:putative oxidoreductase